jgi:glucose-specific phosphotransferase system IIA component
LSGSLDQDIVLSLGADRNTADEEVDVSTTRVLAPIAGRAVSLRDVPDPVFSEGMVGYGAALDPPRRTFDAVAPVGGKILKLLPHAYVVMTPEDVGILVHLGLDTVRLNGDGFTARVSEGDTVTAGQVVITFDVPSVEAAGFNPIVPVVVLDEREPKNVVVEVAAGADIAAGETLFVATR